MAFNLQLHPLSFKWSYSWGMHTETEFVCIPQTKCQSLITYLFFVNMFNQCCISSIWFYVTVLAMGCLGNLSSGWYREYHDPRPIVVIHCNVNIVQDGSDDSTRDLSGHFLSTAPLGHGTRKLVSSPIAVAKKKTCIGITTGDLGRFLFT